MSERIPAGGAYRAATGMHDSLNLEHIVEAKRLLYTYCPGEFCRRFLDLLSEASGLVAKARIEDLSYKESYSGIDSGVMNLYRGLVDFYSGYLSGVLVTVGEDVVVRVLSPLSIDGVVVEAGETVRLPPERAAGLVLAGLAEALRETAIKLPGPD